jgi:hypothetical protein
MAAGDNTWDQHLMAASRAFPRLSRAALQAPNVEREACFWRLMVGSVEPLQFQ